MPGNDASIPLAVGRPTVLVAAGGRVPDLDAHWREVRVDASTVRGGLSVLLLSERVARALDPITDTPGAWGLGRFRQGLRRTLLGDPPGTLAGASLLAALERLALVDGRPLVWVIERAHLADTDSRAWIARQVRHMVGWPVAVVVGVAPEDAWGAGLAAQLRARLGGDSVVDQSGVRPSHPGMEADAPVGDDESTRIEPDSSTIADESTDSGPVGLAVPEEAPALSARARVALLAAATVGHVFELALVSELVGRPTHAVAADLLAAHLSGWTLSDAGPGAMSLDDSAVELLRREVPQAVSRAWNEHLAERFAPQADDREPAGPQDTPDLRQARAAEHAEAAGRPEAAVEALLAAAREAREVGAFSQASQHLARAEQAAAGMGGPGRALSARVRMDRAHLAWAAVGQGVDLLQALAGARQAVDELDAAGDVAGAAEARLLVAAIAHDIGDADHLEEALVALTEASRAWMDAGEARRAAELLNDLAAVWVRIGDPVRAAHLLEESRHVFSRGTSPEDRRELAESLLLSARLPLHVDARPGQQQAALSQAIAHAETAAHLWRELGDPRHAALSQATTGRLMVLAGHAAEALPVLQGALDVLRRHHDVLGMARTADALALALGADGRAEAAVQVLSESVRLNAAAGSTRGLAYNRQSAEELLAAVDASSDAGRALADFLERMAVGADVSEADSRQI